MKTYTLFLLALITSSCTLSEHKQSDEKNRNTDAASEPQRIEQIALDDSTTKALLNRGGKITAAAGKALKTELQEAIKRDGLPYAISFCSDRATEITDSTGIARQVMIRRLAKKNRNPDNAMSDTESELFKAFLVRSFSSPDIPPRIEPDAEGRPVYYKPIVTESFCLNCHGSPGTEILPEVAERIAATYPDDKAVNFKKGHLRGMWAVTFNEYRVVETDPLIRE